MKRTLIKDIKLGEVNKVSGFIENIRNKKWMAFIVIRDVTGKLQITIEKEKHPEITYFLTEKMYDVPGKQKVDLITCTHDVVNYFENWENWEEFFEDIEPFFFSDIQVFTQNTECCNINCFCTLEF